ncbi:MAG: NAD-dependent epimerase/dehydratase family protein [Terrimicrobiaceae bacterium]
MNKNSKIFVAGARGLVGSAILRTLAENGYHNVISPSPAQLDLTVQAKTFSFLKKYRPDYVFVAAAKVGGIWANANFPAEFCYQNLAIEINVIHGSYLAGVRKLLFLGSSCIYPKESEIPIRESSLLTGPLEPTNEGYAIAKIAGIKLCQYYRAQYGCDFISVMPTNTFGPNDNFDLRTGHMLASLLHKFHLAKIKNEPGVSLWGTGRPRREIIYVDNIAHACLFLMNNYSEAIPINLGSGDDHSILDIAELIKERVGYTGRIDWDTSKPDGVYRKVMDVSRILAMGWKPEISMEEGLARTYGWLVENYDTLPIHGGFKKKALIIRSESLARKIKRLLIDPRLANKSLDDNTTILTHRETIQAKDFLRKVYLSHYADFIKIEKSIADQPGVSLEIGSGGGFLKSLLPTITTSEAEPVAGIDRVEEAGHLSFPDGALRAIYMTGVLHHLAKPRQFFAEASRCLREGGYLVMMEPHMSAFGKFFFQVLHHEPNDFLTRKWEFPQAGLLSDANTALPSIIFDRDYEIFQEEFPEFDIVERRFHTFVKYGLSGGVGFRFSAPGWLYGPVSLIESLLTPFMRQYLGTMQTIVLVKNRKR